MANLQIHLTNCCPDNIYFEIDRALNQKFKRYRSPESKYFERSLFIVFDKPSDFDALELHQFCKMAFG